MIFVICSLWLLQGCVEGGSGYFYPKPKYILEITPSIELFSKSITYEESPVTQNYHQKHYQGHDYAQGYTTTRSVLKTPITKNHYVTHYKHPTKSLPTKRYNTGHYNPGNLVQLPSIRSSQKTNNGYIYAPKSIHGNQLIMDMGDYKISVPISSDGIMADGEYLVKIPIYQKVTKK